jgi:hypothetical protein
MFLAENGLVKLLIFKIWVYFFSTMIYLLLLA